MNRTITLKKHTGKVSIMPLTAMFCVILFAGTVLADTGPKRSIDIEFVNPPSEPYFCLKKVLDF